MILPREALSQHIAVLGKTGSGKSATIRGIVESLLDEQKPVCIIDPKGDWYGLKSSRDGTKPGYAVVIFGGEHADVPINAHAGAHIAELVATGNRPCIVDLGGWMVGERTRFFIDFASTLFRHTKGLRWLVIDEVHNFAPQGKVLDPDAGKMLHWANRLASEGRGKGLQIIAASQRPQKVHKDFLTSCETLIAMRVIHPLDRSAIKDWIDGCPDPEKGKEVLQSLASMPRGTGWVWSPEIGFGPTRVAFPMFKTFDSFRAPTGEDVKLKGWAAVDLDDVKAKLASVVAEAEANDPKKLRARIAVLERAGSAPAIDPEALHREYARGKVQGYGAALQALAPAIDRMQTLRTALDEQLGGLIEDLHRWQRKEVAAKPLAPLALPHERRIAQPITGIVTSPVRRLKVSGNGHAPADPNVGTGGLRRILIALAQRPQGLTLRQIGVRAGLSSRSGTFSTYMSKARQAGWIEDRGGRGGLSTLTPAGLSALGAYEPLPTGEALLQHWLGELGNSGAARILQEAARVYPRALSLEELGKRAELSHRSGTFSTYLSRLRSLELIEGRGEIRASEELFG